MITRRLFGKIAAAAPAAMQAAASASISGPLSEFGPVEISSSQVGWAGTASLMADFDMGKHLRRQIAELAGARADRLADYMRGVRRLDADLASMRSLSLSARIRIQAQRDEARDFDRQHGWLQKQLLDLAGKAS